MVSKCCEMGFVTIHGMAFGVPSVGSEVGFTPFYFQVFGSSGRRRGFFAWVRGEVMMMAAGCFLVLDLELQASLWFLTVLSLFSCFCFFLRGGKPRGIFFYSCGKTQLAMYFERTNPVGLLVNTKGTPAPKVIK